MLEQQTRLAALQFDGAAGQGLFEWDDLQQIPRTAQICITCICYRQPAGGLGNLRVVLRNPDGPVSAECVIAQLTGVEITDPAGGFSFLFSCKTVPRNIANRKHWELVVTTIGKSGVSPAGDATVSVDWHIDPFPEREPTVQSANETEAVP